MRSAYGHVEHSFGPLFDENSEILILGSMPSPMSRAVSFYYGNPMNRFWKMIARIYGVADFQSIEEKKAFCLARHIALFDVIKSCDIVGASDASIRNVEYNDIASIVKKTKVKRIILNGGTAASLFERHISVPENIEIIKLPSTSPANARMSLEALVERWKPYLIS